MNQPQPPYPEPPAQTPVPLGPELTIAYAADGRHTLLQALKASPADLCLDLAGVTDFDSAGVQLLLATARSLHQRGHGLHITAASVAVHEGLAVFGLQSLLSAPAPAPH